MEFQVEIIKSIQSVASPALDVIFQIITMFGEELFLIPIVALIFWCINKEMGYWLCWCAAMGNLAVNSIKGIFKVERPIGWEGVRTLRAQTATGYSFPSGHTACATGFFGSIALWLRAHKLVVALCVALIILTGFSRCWLGCHCPKDVLVAWLLSAAVIVAMCCAAKLVHKHPSWDIPLAAAVFTLSALALVFLELKPYPLEYTAAGALLVDPFEMKTDCYKNMGGLMAMSIAWPLERRLIRFSEGGSVPVRIVRGAVGALLVALLYAWLFPVLLKPLLGVQIYAFLRYFVLIILLVAVYPACFKAVESRFARTTANAE